MIQPNSSTTSQFGTRSNPSNPAGRGRKLPKRLLRWCNLSLLAAGTFLAGGCSICETGYVDYATVGGKWQRSHPAEGRVGSPFSDPGFVSTAAAAEGVYHDTGDVSYHDGSDEVYDGIIIENGMEVDGFDGNPLHESVIELDEGW